MVTKVKNKDGDKVCPECKLPLDGRITYTQRAGETRPDWIHTKCLGGLTIGK